MLQKSRMISVESAAVALILFSCACRFTISDDLRINLSEFEYRNGNDVTSSSLKIVLPSDTLRSLYGFSVTEGHLEWKTKCGHNHSVTGVLRQLNINEKCGPVFQFMDVNISSVLDISTTECIERSYKHSLFDSKTTDINIVKDDCVNRESEENLIFTLFVKNHDVPENQRGIYVSEFVLHLKLSDAVCMKDTCDWIDNGRNQCVSETSEMPSDGQSNSVVQSPMMFGGSESCSLVIVRIDDMEHLVAPELILLTYVNNTLEPTVNISSDVAYKESKWTFISYKIGTKKEPFAVQLHGDVCEANISMSGCKEFHGEFAKFGCKRNGHCSWFYNKEISERSTKLWKTYMKSFFSPSLPVTGPGCTLRITGDGCFTAIAHHRNSQFRLLSHETNKSLSNGKKEFLTQIGRTDGGVLIQVKMKSSCLYDEMTFVNCHRDQEKGNYSVCGEDNLYTCKSGLCIDKEAECDLVKDCLDGDDEETALCSDRVSEWNCDFENINNSRGKCHFLLLANRNFINGDSGKCNLKVRTAKETRIGNDHTLNLGTGHFLHLDKTPDNCGIGLAEDSVFTNILQPGNFVMKRPAKCEVTVSVAAAFLDSSGLMTWGINICDINFKSCHEVQKFDLTEKSWKTYNVKIPSQNTSFRVQIFAKYLFLGDSIAFDDIFFNTHCLDYVSVHHAKTEINWLPHVIAVGTVFVVFVILFIVFFYRNCFILKRILNYPCNGYLSTETSDSSITDESLLPSLPHDVFGRIDNLLTEKNPNYTWYSERCLNYFIKTISPTRLRIQCLLGGGQFGEVYKGMLIRDSSQRKDQIVAIKKLLPTSSEDSRTEFILEAFTLSKFKHRNIVKCIGVSLNGSEILMIQEYLSGGDLKEYLLESRNQKTTLLLDIQLSLALDIASAGQYLEQNNFIHRDLAARNCFLSTKGPLMVAKIGDFGLARDIENTSCYVKSGQGMLPLRWMPPEAFIDGVYSTKSDVWSYGVLLWEILSYGEHPYSGWSNLEVQRNVSSGQRLEYPSKCSLKLCSLLRMCWETDPCNRPSFISICQQLTTIKSSSQEERCEVTYTAIQSNKEGQSRLCYSGEESIL